MKKTLFLLILITAAYNMFAADTLHVKETQIPILIDRKDNVLFYLRLDAKDAKRFDNISLRFGKAMDLTNIKAVKLYYGGTEAPVNIEKGEMRFAPNEYISRNTPGKTREADRSYSLKTDELPNPDRTLTLSADKELFAGINYFWISIEMKTNAPLTDKITCAITAVNADEKPLAVKHHSPDDIEHRLGIGVRHAGDDGSAAYRIPGLVTTNKGTLLAVYDIRYNNSADLQEHIDIGISRSTDKGQTWEKMRTAMAFGNNGGLPLSQNGVGDPAILVDKQTGTIWVIAAWTHGLGNGRAWTNSRQGMDKYHTAQLMLVRSDDDGQSWSEPINITEQVKQPEWYFCFQGPGMGITMHDGTLVFAAQYIDKDRIPNACIIYSKDHGMTWALHNLARTNTTESQVAEINPGTLMLNMRDNRGGSRAVATTNDLGRTWTEHPSSRSALQEPVCMASLIKSDAKDNAFNKDILLFSNPNTTEGRNHITVKASLDNGMTWQPEHQILIDEADGWGYSCLTMIDRETVGILYEGSTAHMVFQAIKLKDIIE